MKLPCEIKYLDAFNCSGQKTRMSLVNNKTLELWRNFSPRIKDIPAIEGSELYSVEIYPDNYFQQFNPAAEFEKWAAVKVYETVDIPDGMEILQIQAGRYAVFYYKGPASAGQELYSYIFNTWLPSSDFQLDIRPHLAVMGDKYSNTREDSEEEIWIPVKQ